MSWWSTLGLAVGLAMDALAVAIATGLMLPSVTPRHTFRLSFHFGLFQFLMPVIGWLAGRTIETYINGYDHWLAFAMLSFIGGKMIWEARDGHHSEEHDDPTRGWMLVTLSIATSLDALAVGLSLAFLNIPIWTPSVVIGVVAGVLTMLGIHFGSRLGHRCGRLAEVVGGVVLLGIGVRILVSHVMGG